MVRFLRKDVTMLRIRALFLALVLVLPFAAVRPAQACGGAILRDMDESAAMLREAEDALENGDLRWARELARDVSINGEEIFYARASRIEALSWARDPSASEADLVNAVSSLGEQMKSAELRTPALEADFAEAAARLPQHKDDARRQLLSLSDRDLMGSPYAYAALARLADEHGDAQVAKDARARCTTMALDASVCGATLRAPVTFRLHGKPSAYAGAAAAAIALLLVRVLRRRKPAARPWIGFGARAQSIGIGVAAVFAVALGRHPYAATFVVLAAGFVGLVLERRFFLRAVRKGRVPGYVLRPSVDEDPKAALRLHFGPSQDETLERVTEDAHYRIASRRPLLRIAGRSRRGTVGGVLALAMVALAATSFLATLGIV